MIRKPLWRQGSHTFTYASFQDFSWSELRFSRTTISELKDCQMLYDSLPLLEKYSSLISYLVRYNSAEIEAGFADNSCITNSLSCLMETPNCLIMKISHCFIMKTPNYLDRCLTSCFLLRVTTRLLWNTLWVVHILSIAQP